MPISPENRKRYPSYWRQLSHIVRFVLQRGKCAWCDARHGMPHPVTGSVVVLTTAHIHDMRPEADRLDNLRGLCHRCRSRHDAAQRHSTRRSKNAIGDLFSTRGQTGRDPASSHAGDAGGVRSDRPVGFLSP